MTQTIYDPAALDRLAAGVIKRALLDADPTAKIPCEWDEERRNICTEARGWISTTGRDWAEVLLAHMHQPTYGNRRRLRGRAR